MRFVIFDPMKQKLEKMDYQKRVDHCGACVHFRAQVYFLDEPGTGKIRRANHKCKKHDVTVSIHGICKDFRSKE